MSLIRKGSKSDKAAVVFEIGERVTVKGYDGEGTVRFVGKEAGGGKSRVGIEMDGPVGKNNGTVKGHTYFKCKKKRGLLSLPKNVRCANGEVKREHDDSGGDSSSAGGAGVLAALRMKETGNATPLGDAAGIVAVESKQKATPLPSEEKQMTVRERLAAAKAKDEAERAAKKESEATSPIRKGFSPNGSQTGGGVDRAAQKATDMAAAAERQEKLEQERKELREARADVASNQMSDAQVAEKEWLVDSHMGPVAGKWDAKMQELSRDTIDRQVKVVLQALLSKYAGTFEIIAKEAAEFKESLKETGINPADPGVTLDEGGITKFLMKHDITRPELSSFMAQIHLDPRGKKGERRYPFVAYMMLKLGIGPNDIFALEIEKLDPKMKQAHQATFTYQEMLATSVVREATMAELKEVADGHGLQSGRARVQLSTLQDEHYKETRMLIKAKQANTAALKYIKDNDPFKIEQERLAAQAEKDAAEEAHKRQSARRRIKGMQAAFFTAADTDGDGNMSWSEAKAKGMDRKTFDSIDTDGDGQVTQEEFSAWQEQNDQIF